MGESLTEECRVEVEGPQVVIRIRMTNTIDFKLYHKCINYLNIKIKDYVKFLDITKKLTKKIVRKMINFFISACYRKIW